MDPKIKDLKWKKAKTSKPENLTGLVCRIFFLMPIEEVLAGKINMEPMQITSTNGGLSIALFFTKR